MDTFGLVMVVHTIFAAAWTGGALLISGTIIPAARNGLIEKNGLSLITRRFWYLTVGSVVLLLLTGGHLAGTLYTAESLQSTERGHLVLSMVALWFVLPLVLYLGSRHLTDIPPELSAETAAAAARPWFIGASAISIALLVIAGLL
ncbi:hypothetical protein C493_20676 [Natronolimnohabitans innermongolicus JCM 12255]|uniref:Copper resistance protein D domain-containing protein n=2 Tax=Natronolimnohabitans innermongolicus TaxID=253107 RepID=L9WIP6_9EURY|nr:hypothetical protein C493_20676 [Natronolimnohabitans innermongolicus JCM 12255]